VRRSLACAVALLSAVLAGCPDEDPLSDPDKKFSIDSGIITSDAGFFPPPRDAGTAPDASEPRDAEPPDTGAGPQPCVCPMLPVACALPAPDRPAFTPGGTALIEQLMGVIACSEDRLRIAVYETDWECIVRAVLSRVNADPDLVVELVIDDERCPIMNGTRTCELFALEGHPRITMVDDQRSRFMHHKFVLADDRRVWVSSANFTQRSFCTEANDGIVIEEPAIIAAYGAEFERMFVTSSFGPRPRTPAVSAGRYSVYLSPETPIDQPSTWFEALVRAVDTASVSVDFLVAAWTRPELSEALVRAHQRGVTVRGVVSAAYSDDPPALAAIAAGIPLKVGLVHDKLLIVDALRVATGSPNWSEASWANNENSLWIEDAAIAAEYRAHFERSYAAAMNP
jgi:hypothetical protein